MVYDYSTFSSNTTLQALVLPHFLLTQHCKLRFCEIRVFFFGGWGVGFDKGDKSDKVNIFQWVKHCTLLEREYEDMQEILK